MGQSAFFVSNDLTEIKLVAGLASTLFDNVEFYGSTLLIEHAGAEVRVQRQSDSTFEALQDQEEDAIYSDLLGAKAVALFEVYAYPSRDPRSWNLVRNLVSGLMEKYNCVLYEDINDRFWTRDTLPETFREVDV